MLKISHVSCWDMVCNVFRKCLRETSLSRLHSHIGPHNHLTYTIWLVTTSVFICVYTIYEYIYILYLNLNSNLFRVYHIKFENNTHRMPFEFAVLFHLFICMRINHMRDSREKKKSLIVFDQWWFFIHFSQPFQMFKPLGFVFWLGSWNSLDFFWIFGWKTRNIHKTTPHLKCEYVFVCL